MKNVLITGARGFVGKNLANSLAYLKDLEISSFDHGDDLNTLPALIQDADFIFHLAGVNRPQNIDEFTTGNIGLTQTIISQLIKFEKKTPLLITSSIQAALENPYGKSKREAEQAVFSYGAQTGAAVYVYRLPNIFGKWSRPNYNSVVATFCYNMARELPIQVNDPSAILNLVYIDDVVEEFISVMSGMKAADKDFCHVLPVHSVGLGDLVTLIQSFQRSRMELTAPDMSDSFTKKLYSTYLSFLPQDNFSYPLKMHVDERGSFTEFLKSPDRGQVSVNVSKAGITRGNHWHHTKNEKFLVVSGTATINFRLVGGEEVITYHVSGEKLEVVDIPPGYTHNIINTGKNDLVTIMWANEQFDPARPDTNFLSVKS